MNDFVQATLEFFNCLDSVFKFWKLDYCIGQKGISVWYFVEEHSISFVPTKATLKSTQELKKNVPNPKIFWNLVISKRYLIDTMYYIRLVAQ